jgi:glycogen debranching enzyme
VDADRPRPSTAVDAARALWRDLLAGWHERRDLQREHWRQFLKDSTRLESGDATLDQAFLWSKIAVERAWTRVEGVGRGLIAGLGPSRGRARPGHAWFFGADALAAARAMSACGDFEGVREILRFVASTQRADGKLMHELSLSAGLCDWDGDYPYAWARSRVTPEFVAGLAAHVRASGDLLLARELWPAALRAL